jgi:putative membrane protein
LLIVLILIFTRKYFEFSDTAYILMSFLIFLHTIGGHYSFARVPFDFVTNLFSFERNNFDRVAHFTVGFYAYAVAELLHAKKLVNSKVVLLLFPLFFIMSLAASYELFEWQYAVLGNPEAGVEVLGSQGDIWDSQRDMLADTLGAITALGLFWLFNRRELKSI